MTLCNAFIAWVMVLFGGPGSDCGAVRPKTVKVVHAVPLSLTDSCEDSEDVGSDEPRRGEEDHDGGSPGFWHDIFNGI